MWGALQDPPSPTLGDDLIWTEIPGCGVEMSLALVHSTENAGFTQSCNVSPTPRCSSCPALLLLYQQVMDGRDVTPAGALRPCDTQTNGWGWNAGPRAMLNSDLLGDFFLRKPSSPDRADGL